jgi:MFS family permease
VSDLGWQWAFHTALILSIVLFAISAKILQRDNPGQVTKSIDYAGAGILMGGITLLLLYATEGPTLGWLSSEELAFLIPGAALFIGFFFYESKATKNPLIHLGLLKIKNVLVANLVGIISGITMFLLFFALIYYTQLPSGYGLGLKIIQSGWTLAPSTLGMLVGGPLIGRFTQRSGPKPALIVGSSLSILGLILFIFNRATATAVAIDLVVALAGVVCVIVPIVNMLAISLPKENIAVGLGMNTMLRNLGGAVGPVVATVIMSTYTSKLVIPENGKIVVLQFPTASAFNYIFEIGIVLMIVAAGISLATKNYTFRKKSVESSNSYGEEGQVSHEESKQTRSYKEPETKQDRPSQQVK